MCRGGIEEFCVFVCHTCTDQIHDYRCRLFYLYVKTNYQISVYSCTLLHEACVCLLFPKSIFIKFAIYRFVWGFQKNAPAGASPKSQQELGARRASSRPAGAPSRRVFRNLSRKKRPCGLSLTHSHSNKQTNNTYLLVV